MFQQLVPLLRQRSVLLTVTLVEDDQVCVNLMPKKLAEGENTALTIPMSFTGSPDELDAELPAAISSFITSHLQLKNTLMRAKEKMEAAAKAAQEEARNKAKSTKKGNDTATKATAMEKKDVGKKEEETKAPTPPSLPGLFDAPAGAAAPPAPVSVEAVSSAVEADEVWSVFLVMTNVLKNRHFRDKSLATVLRDELTQQCKGLSGCEPVVLQRVSVKANLDHENRFWRCDIAFTHSRKADPHL